MVHYFLDIQYVCLSQLDYYAALVKKTREATLKKRPISEFFFRFLAVKCVFLPNLTFMLFVQDMWGYDETEAHGEQEEDEEAEPRLLRFLPHLVRQRELIQEGLH